MTTAISEQKQINQHPTIQENNNKWDEEAFGALQQNVVEKVEESIEHTSPSIQNQEDAIQATETEMNVVITDATQFVTPAISSEVAATRVTPISETVDHEQAMQAVAAALPINLEAPKNIFKVNSELVDTPDGPRILDTTQADKANDIEGIRKAQRAEARNNPSRIQVKSIMTLFYNLPGIKQVMSIFR